MPGTCGWVDILWASLSSDPLMHPKCLSKYSFVSFSCRGEYDAVAIWRDCDDTLAKGFVIECRQADAVAGILRVAFMRFISPWYDMVSKQQLSDVDTCKSAKASIISENHPPKMVLAFALFGK